jgi:hypothetical protein
VFELSFLALHAQRIKPANLAVDFRHKHLIIANEFRRDREVCFPVLDPVLGITPVTLRVKRDLRQHRSFINSGCSDHYS